jgi:starvation-inducible DNA-binding protein
MPEEMPLRIRLLERLSERVSLRWVGGSDIRSSMLKPLSVEDVRKVARPINPLVADALALYVKTKNFHWHPSGARFRDLHPLFDEQAEAIFESTDALAERVRRLGGTTLRSVSHRNRLQTIEDDEEEFVRPDEMVRKLMEDDRHLAGTQRRTRSVRRDRGCGDDQRT